MMRTLSLYLLGLVAVFFMTQSARQGDVAWVLAWGFLLLVTWPKDSDA